MSKQSYKIFTAVLLLCAAAVRIVYYFIGEPSNILVHYVLPVSACLIYSAGFITESKKLMFSGVIFGCLFFIVKAFGFGTIQLILCISLYLLLGILFYFTFFYFKKKNIILFALLASALAVHAVWDIYDFAVQNYKSFLDFTPELSILLIMSALTISTHYNYIQKINDIIIQNNI